MPRSLLTHYYSTAVVAIDVRRGELLDDRDGRGATMSEYGILLFFVGIAAFLALGLFGQEVLELFSTTESEWDNSTNNPAPAD